MPKPGISDIGHPERQPFDEGHHLDALFDGPRLRTDAGCRVPAQESVGHEVVVIRTVYAGYLSPSISEALTQDYVRRRKREDSGNPLCKLSPREREIFRLLVNGKSNKEIAYQLSISSKTVETYRSRMMEKLGIHDLPALVKLAIESGVTTLD
jgi:DNA-binding NarL/FixJ family response regulator